MSPEAQYWVTVTKLTNSRNGSLWIAALCAFLLLTEPLSSDPSAVKGVVFAFVGIFLGADAYQTQQRLQSLCDAGPPRDE